MGEEKPPPIAFFHTGFNSFGKEEMVAPPAGCPSRFGPRHWGQSAARAGTNIKHQTPNTNKARNLKHQPKPCTRMLLFGAWRADCKTQNPKAQAGTRGELIRSLGFGLLSDFGLRASDFS